MVRAIRGVESTPGALYTERVVQRARGGAAALHQNGVHVVQTAFGNLDNAGIIPGHDVVTEEDVVIFMPRQFVYFCPCCGSEIDVHDMKQEVRVPF